MKDYINLSKKKDIHYILFHDLNYLSFPEFPDYITDKPAYLYDVSRVHILDEIMRQKSNSGIVYLAHRALNGQPIHHDHQNHLHPVVMQQFLLDHFLNLFHQCNY